MNVANVHAVSVAKIRTHESPPLRTIPGLLLRLDVFEPLFTAEWLPLIKAHMSEFKLSPSCY